MRGIQQQTFSNHWSRRKLWEETPETLDTLLAAVVTALFHSSGDTPILPIISS